MKFTLSSFFTRAVAGASLAAAGLFAFSADAEIAVKDGQKVAFMGDSITQGGWGSPGGYVKLIVAGLEANGVKVAPVPAGISGHKSNQMLERLKRDVLDKKPDWMTLSCGVNDVWHGARGVPLDQYKANITKIADECAAAGVKVIVLTATVIGEELENDNNNKLRPYNEFLRGLARERKLPLADLFGQFETAIKAAGGTGGNPGRLLTSDGVHMNPAGDQLMARGVLQAMGLDEAQIKKAQDSWLDIPGAVSLRARFDAGQGKSLQATARVTMRQSEKLKALAAKEGKPLDAILGDAYKADVTALLKPAGEYENAAAIFAAKKEKEVQAALEKKFSAKVEELLKK